MTDKAANYLDALLGLSKPHGRTQPESGQPFQNGFVSLAHVEEASVPFKHGHHVTLINGIYKGLSAMVAATVPDQYKVVIEKTTSVNRNVYPGATIGTEVLLPMNNSRGVIVAETPLHVSIKTPSNETLDVPTYDAVMLMFYTRNNKRELTDAFKTRLAAELEGHQSKDYVLQHLTNFSVVSKDAALQRLVSEKRKELFREIDAKGSERVFCGLVLTVKDAQAQYGNVVVSKMMDVRPVRTPESLKTKEAILEWLSHEIRRGVPVTELLPPYGDVVERHLSAITYFVFRSPRPQDIGKYGSLNAFVPGTFTVKYALEVVVPKSYTSTLDKASRYVKIVKGQFRNAEGTAVEKIGASLKLHIDTEKRVVSTHLVKQNNVFVKKYISPNDVLYHDVTVDTADAGPQPAEVLKITKSNGALTYAVRTKNAMHATVSVNGDKVTGFLPGFELLKNEHAQNDIQEGSELFSQDGELVHDDADRRVDADDVDDEQEDNGTNQDDFAYEEEADDAHENNVAHERNEHDMRNVYSDINRLTQNMEALVLTDAQRDHEKNVVGVLKVLGLHTTTIRTRDVVRTIELAVAHMTKVLEGPMTRTDEKIVASLATWSELLQDQSTVALGGMSLADYAAKLYAAGYLKKTYVKNSAFSKDRRDDLKRLVKENDYPRVFEIVLSNAAALLKDVFDAKTDATFHVIKESDLVPLGSNYRTDSTHENYSAQFTKNGRQYTVQIFGNDNEQASREYAKPPPQPTYNNVRYNKTAFPSSSKMYWTPFQRKVLDKIASEFEKKSAAEKDPRKHAALQYALQHIDNTHFVLQQLREHEGNFAAEMGAQALSDNVQALVHVQAIVFREIDKLERKREQHHSNMRAERQLQRNKIEELAKARVAGYESDSE